MNWRVRVGIGLRDWKDIGSFALSVRGSGGSGGETRGVRDIEARCSGGGEAYVSGGGETRGGDGRREHSGSYAEGSEDMVLWQR